MTSESRGLFLSIDEGLSPLRQVQCASSIFYNNGFFYKESSPWVWDSVLSLGTIFIVILSNRFLRYLFFSYKNRGTYVVPLMVLLVVKTALPVYLPLLRFLSLSFNHYSVCCLIWPLVSMLHFLRVSFLCCEYLDSYSR